MANPLRAKIAGLIKAGKSDREVYGVLCLSEDFLAPVDLIAVIREVITEQTDSCREEFRQFHRGE